MRISDTYAKETSDSIDSTNYLSNLYEILGMQRNATKIELRNAYWNIASKSHPDRNNVCMYDMI